MDFHNHFSSTNNRAEAERWLSTAVKLLTTRDLHGTKTFAIRARESDPRLGATDQIIAVADTLLAGESRISNNQHDWYSILGLAHPTHSPDLVATQYRRLALLLNPHANHFPFADQAFALVSEAWSVLSNPSSKSLYDQALTMYSPRFEPQHSSGSTQQLFERQFLQMHASPQQQQMHHFQQHLHRPQPIPLQPIPQQEQQQQQMQLERPHPHPQPQPQPIQQQKPQPPPQQPARKPEKPQPPPQRQQAPAQQQHKPVRKSPRKKDGRMEEETPIQPNNNNNVNESAPPPPPPPPPPPSPPPSPPPAPESDPPPVESEPVRPSQFDSGESFWTACPYCYNLYEYPSVYEECMLRCQNCRRAFHAVVISSPPVTAKGEANFCCWGYYPLGKYSGKNVKKTGGSYTWTPFSTMFEVPLPANKRNAGRGGEPRVVYKDDIEDHDTSLDLSDESSEESDDEWGNGRRKKKRAGRPKGKASKTPVRASDRIRKVTQNVGSVSNGETSRGGGATASRAESSKRSGNTRKRGAAALGKLDLNVEFSNNEVEEPAAQTVSEGNGTANGEEDNTIEGISFFEGLDEFLSSLPILNVVDGGDGKVKAN